MNTNDNINDVLNTLTDIVELFKKDSENKLMIRWFSDNELLKKKNDILRAIKTLKKWQTNTHSGQHSQLL